MSEHKEPIPSMIYNAAVGGHVTNSQQIIDENENKDQSQINAEIKEALGTGGSVDNRIAEEGAKHYLKEETYSKSELNNMITTPNQKYVSVTATAETTVVTNILPSIGATDTTYRVGNWDGTQYNDSVFSEYAWNGNAYIKLSTKSQIGEVYDISTNHADTKYIDLNAALGTNGDNIPRTLRRGGMNIKFVQSSDNKYVQFRFMLSGSFSTAQFINPINWQGVDEEPSFESNNLVESGGVYKRIGNLRKEIRGLNTNDTISVIQNEIFDYSLDITGVNGICNIEFSGYANLFDDVIAVMIDSVVVLRIEEDGNYTINIPKNSTTLQFYRNAAHVIGTGSVTINCECFSGLLKDIENSMSELETTLTKSIKDTDNEIIQTNNILFGIENTKSITVSAGNSFTTEIELLGMSGYKLLFHFAGRNLFSQDVAVYNTSSSTPVFMITEDGDYEIPITDYEKVWFFRNALQVSGTGTVTITYKTSNENVINVINNINTTINGFISNNIIPVTAGRTFSFEVDASKLIGKLLSFDFRGKNLFDDVVAVYNTNGNTPVLTIDKDGVYLVPVTEWGKISFLRNAAHVISSGNVQINISSVGIIDVLDNPPLEKVYIENFLNGVTKKQKYLTRIGFLGDSLTANAVGGSIPLAIDEGDTMRPMRLLTNNIPRRFYDKASWNKPQFRRLDNTDWSINGFSVLSGEQLFWGTEEVYHTAQNVDAYAEITIPNGYEHFAIICRTKSGFGTLNIRINGNNPSSILYSNPIIDDAAVTGETEGNPKSTLIYKLQNNANVNTSYCPITLPCGQDSINLGIGVGQGNPYAIYEYNNLPSGDNLIRISPVDATRVDIWGVFYWSGNSMVVINMGYGGHSTTSLLSVYRDVVFNDNVHFDGFIFELPIMNDTDPNKVGNIEVTKANVQTFIDKLGYNDVLFTTCHPFGMSIIHDTNFYEQYKNPTMEQVSEAAREIVLLNKKPLIDLFRIFKKLIIDKGGTLEGGEAGLWYTWDGQHENITCSELWFSNLWESLKNKPLMITDN